VVAFALPLQALALDMGKVTCGAFLDAGQANMAPMIMWLLGYHDGKRGSIIATSADEMRAYGANLGQYCALHRESLLTEASEKVLSGKTD